MDLSFLDSLPPVVRENLLRVLALILGFLIIWLTRRFLTAVVMAPIRRIVKRSNNSYDDAIINALTPSVRLIVISLGAVFVANLILYDDTVFFSLINTLARVLIIVAGLSFLFRLVDVIAPNSVALMHATGIDMEERLIPFMRVAAKVIISSLGIVIVLQEFGYDVTGLLAGLGLGGLAFSFAAQDTVENLFGFGAILTDNPFDVGDYIKTSHGEGIVEHVGVRSTRLRQLDQALVTVPNGLLAKTAVLNWSRLSKRRVDFILGVTYETNTQQMNTLLDRLRTMLRERETVQEDSVVVYFISFGDSSLDILVRCYVHITDWAEYTAEQELIQLAIMDIVEELGLGIAFPSRSLYIENLPTTLYDTIAKPLPEPESKKKLPENTSTSEDYKPDMPHGDEAFKEDMQDETPEQD